MQSKKGSFKEALQNVAIGLSINMVANAYIIPIVLGVRLPVKSNIYLGVFFTVISISRSYIIRRWNNRKELIKSMV